MPHPVRCAIYTRRSIDLPSEQQVNSLESQREVCSAYIRCNGHLGWAELPQSYDDGGRSGATLDRPAINRLICDIENGLIDVVVFYKIDRLTRSLSDFVRLMDSLSGQGVAFVSVTQSFDTSTSMGRMILNILLTFAQFEREMLADRIRDKLMSMRQRGLHVQGKVPLGYDKVNGRLVVNEAEAETVRGIFERFEQFPTVLSLMKQLQREGVTVKRVTTRSGRVIGGAPIHRGVIYAMIRNPLYIGYIACEGVWYEGLHDPIVERALWDHVQAVQAARHCPKPARDPGKHLLSGLICDQYDRRLFVREGGKPHERYRFYQTAPKCPSRRHYLDLIRVRADHVEDLTQHALAALVTDPERVRRMLLSSGDCRTNMKTAGSLCASASARFSRLSRSDLRSLYEALLVRVEVTKTELRWLLSHRNTIRFIHGAPLNALGPLSDNAPEGKVYLLTVNAHLVSAHRDFCLPIEVRADAPANRNRGLVNLLTRAAEAEKAVLSRRTEQVTRIAADFKLGPSKFSRLLRLNYLAPDIKTAIMDGHQPHDLTAHRLLYSALPLDWQQQRTMLGFLSSQGAAGAQQLLEDTGQTIG